MPNNVIIKAKNMSTFKSLGMELIKVATSLLMLGIALMLLSGLSTLRFRNAFRLTLDENEKNNVRISTIL